MFVKSEVGGVGFMQKRNDALFDASKLSEAESLTFPLSESASEVESAGEVETFQQFLLEVVTSQKSLPDKAQSRAE